MSADVRLSQSVFFSAHQWLNGLGQDSSRESTRRRNSGTLPLITNHTPYAGVGAPGPVAKIRALLGNPRGAVGRVWHYCPA
jgi:hypothetical protein